MNWAEVTWSTAAGLAFADALIEGQMVKFQVCTRGEALSAVVRARVRSARQSHEAECREKGQTPWWRDPAFKGWMKVKEAHKCEQGFGCGKAAAMGSTAALW